MRRVLSRLGFYVLALWASVTLNFIIPRLMPGDPVEAYLAKMQGQHVTTQMIAALRIQFGLSDAPLPVQYVQYLGNLLHGNLGVSVVDSSSVTADLLQRLPWTLGLVGIAVILSFVIGTSLGVLTAWKRGTWVDAVIPPALTFISSVPYFWMALALIYVFSLMIPIFPLGSGYDYTNYTPDWSPGFILNVLYYGILPAITIVFGSISGWVLVMRNTMITTLSEDYVLMAQAKGLSQGRVTFGYAARNAILPSITSFSISLAQIVGGSLLTEMVFNYPGIGYMLYTAVNNLDYSEVEGCFLVIAIAVLTANLISDVLYSILDPRVRHGKA